MAAFNMEQRQLRLQSRSNPAAVPYPLDVPVTFPPQPPSVSSDGFPGGGTADAAPGAPAQATEASSRPFAIVSEGMLLPGSAFSALPPQPPPSGSSDGFHGGGGAAEEFSGDLFASPSQGDLEAEVESVPEAGAAFDNSSIPLDGATSVRSLGSEDLPLSELLLSESRWWEQVRDAAPVAQVDPLEGKAVDFRSTFRSACQLQGPSPGPEGLTQPWEEGIFGVIFGGKDFLEPPAKRAFQVFLPGEEAKEAGVSEAAAKRVRPTVQDFTFRKVVRARAVVDWKQQRSAQLGIGLDLWLSLVSRWGDCLLAAHLDACVSRDDKLEVLGDIMKGKAPSTILKRARALILLQDFLADKNVTFPCRESDVYDFLKTLERDGAPSSRISSIMEALNFVRHVIGVSEIESSCLSRRCKGICTTVHFSEPRQAPPLTVTQLEVLHDALEKHADQWTRAFAGACLVCCYSRCRWSDVQHTEDIIWDQDHEGNLCFIELRIGVHKTCRLQSKRHKFLHAISPALGIRPFGQLWRTCREQLGIESQGRCPFMPAPDAQGSPTVRALDTDEATSWMRLMLELGDGSPQVSSKSMKATIISWAAKRGVDPLTLQRLGYHAAGGMDLVYSRDSQAPLLLVVEKVLKEVREGIFRPDETRSGRLVSGGAKPLTGSFVPGLGETSVAEGAAVHEQVPATCKVEVASAEAADAAIVTVSDSEASDSFGESSDESDEDFGQPIAFVARGQVIPAGFDLWRHSSSQVAHLAPRANFKNLFACGRTVGSKHFKRDEQELGPEDFPCKFCFRR